jgi:transposase
MRPAFTLGRVSNVLSEEKKQQVIGLGRLGWTLRRIEGATGVRRETAANYLRAAGIPVRAPGRWGRCEAKPANEVSTDSGVVDVANTATKAKPANEVSTDFGGGITEAKSANAVSTEFSASASACEPYREFIENSLAKGRNAMAIWQDLVDQHGFARRYASVRRFVVKVRGERTAEACAVITTAPGEEAQVDYGSGPMVRDADTGQYRRTRLFVLTLGYSRKSVRLLTFASSTSIWAQLHQQALARLGGAPRVLVLDNLREGIITPDVYDPTINHLYSDMLAHYGITALPCRVRHPDRKGKVEAAVGHAQKTPLKGLRFESLEDAQAYLDCWEERWADTRIHGTTKRQVAAMFAEERPNLLRLPIEPFRYYRYGERTVHLDGCIEVEAAYYGAPPGWVGKRIRVQWDGFYVRLLDPQTGQLLREHLRSPRGTHRIRDEDRSRKTPLAVGQLLAGADRAGTSVGQLCRIMYDRRGEAAVRRVLGVLSLARKYGAAAVEEACAAAIELDVYEYRFVRRYLERTPAAPLSLRQVDPLIRQLTLLPRRH